jgi:hypothetical protein
MAQHFQRMRLLADAALLAPQAVGLFQPNRFGIDPDAEECVGLLP